MEERDFLPDADPAVIRHRARQLRRLVVCDRDRDRSAIAKNLEVKPYAISDVTTDLIGPPRRSNDLDGDVGFDLKYGVSQSVTADFTYNTDFAQVEADEQQVNLTRFSLFFPEKREFFLENQGTFAFAGVGGGQTTTVSGGGETPILFY